MQIAMILILGLITGLVSGLLGVGGGLIMVPAFTYLFHMDFPKAIGTSLVIIVPIALVGSLKHFMSGNIELKLMWMFALTAIVGGWVGASLVNVLPVNILKKIFSVFLICVAVYMILEK